MQALGSSGPNATEPSEIQGLLQILSGFIQQGQRTLDEAGGTSQRLLHFTAEIRFAAADILLKLDAHASRSAEHLCQLDDFSIKLRAQGDMLEKITEFLATPPPPSAQKQQQMPTQIQALHSHGPYAAQPPKIQEILSSLINSMEQGQRNLNEAVSTAQEVLCVTAANQLAAEDIVRKLNAHALEIAAHHSQIIGCNDELKEQGGILRTITESLATPPPLPVEQQQQMHPQMQGKGAVVHHKEKAEGSSMGAGSSMGDREGAASLAGASGHRKRSAEQDGATGGQEDRPGKKSEMWHMDISRMGEELPGAQGGWRDGLVLHT
jgi:hypothetical protein